MNSSCCFLTKMHFGGWFGVVSGLDSLNLFDVCYGLDTYGGSQHREHRGVLKGFMFLLWNLTFHRQVAYFQFLVMFQDNGYLTFKLCNFLVRTLQNSVSKNGSPWDLYKMTFVLASRTLFHAVVRETKTHSSFFIAMPILLASQLKQSVDLSKRGNSCR